MIIQNLQEQVGVWSQRNFPASTPDHPFLGLVEEIGELATAADSEDEKDAVGDTFIFLLDYCRRRGHDLGDIISGLGLSVNLRDFQTDVVMNRDTFDPERSLVGWVGKLAHSKLKSAQGIRGTLKEHLDAERTACGEIAVALAEYCSACEWIFADIVTATWDRVSQRDWTKDRANGREFTRSTNPYEDN